MSDHIGFLLLGLGNGAVFAALALALAVTYRSSGVINFATSPIALYTAYTYAYLRNGELVLLVPGLPKTVDLGGDPGTALAIALSMVMAGILGILLYLLIFRPLRNAPTVAKAVASVGLLIMLQSLIANRVGTKPVSVDRIFPDDVYEFSDIRLPADRVWFAATVVLIAVVVAAGYQFTRFGLQTRAAAETEKGAVVSGVSPERVAAVNWVVSSMVAGISGILISPIVPLVPVAYTLFIVPALAAAVLGQFQSVALAVAGGLAIGMFQSEAGYLQIRYDWMPASGTPELVPLLLILAVLVVRGRPLPTRGALIQSTLGRAPRPRSIVVPTGVATAIAALGLVVLDDAWRAALLTSLVVGILTLSLVVVTGYAGQVSLAQLTLAGVGAFFLSRLTTDWGVPFPVAPLLAALFATVIGVIIGLPALRTRGLVVGIVTLALAVAVEAFWFRNIEIAGVGARVDDAELFGLDMGPGAGGEFPRLTFCFMCLALLVVVAIGVAKLRTSRLGSAMLAVRADERSAAASGIDVVRVKIASFAIGSFLAGLAGTLMGYQQPILSFQTFSIVTGLGLFATAYLAGITSVSGGLLAGLLSSGGLVFYALDQWTDLGSWYDAIAGAGLILAVILNPEGIVGPFHEFAARRRRRAVSIADRITTVAPSDRAEVVASATDQQAAGPVHLSVGNVSVSYGPVVAVEDVSFEVPAGRILGIIGPNGAGKTTLLDALSGFTPGRGETTLSGLRLSDLKPHRRVRAGLGRTFQSIGLYEDLSVAENIQVGLTAGLGRGASSKDIDRVTLLLGLDPLRDRPAAELSQGQRQLVSIARALVGRPQILLLDEPAAGLDTAESAWLGERLRTIRDTGTPIVLVDHDMSLVLGLCDEILVLDFGKVIAQGTPAEVRSDQRVSQAYLGTSHEHQELL